MSARAWSLLLRLSFIWGSSFYIVEVGLVFLDPFWLVSLRVVTGAVVLNTGLYLAGHRLPNSRTFWGGCLVIGLLNNILPFTFLAIGQQSVTGGVASILNANTAFFGVIVAAIFLRSEPLYPHRLVGVIIGVMGVVIAIGPSALLTLDVSSAGQFFIILATLCYSFATVWGKLKLSSYPALSVAAAMLVCSAMMSVPTALVMSGPPPVEMFLPANRLGLLQVIIGIGVFCTALAYPIYFKILALAGASNLSLVTIIIPVFAISLDAALLGQFVTSQEVMGFGLVVVGLAVMDGRILTLLGVRRG